MGEIYRQIAGWDNFLVSNFGNIKSVDRLEDFKGGKRKRFGRVMKQRVLRKYFCIGLRQNKRSKNFFVHRLVARAFLPNPNNYDIVNHKDGNRENNRWDNLEWCTQKMNIHHAMAADNWTRGERHGNSKVSDSDVILLRMAKTKITDLANSMGISYSTAKKIRSNKSWRHIK